MAALGLMLLPALLWLSHAHASDPCSPVDPSLIPRLDSPMSATDPVAYKARIDLLRGEVDALRCPGPNPVPALFRTFLRSRYGSPDTAIAGPLSPLPEDPDLFEAALEALLAQPEERLRQGAREGLGTGMAALVWSRMRHDWVRPAAAGLSTEDRRWVEHWSPPPSSPGSLEQLLGMLDVDPHRTLRAMTTEGGSLLHEVVAPLQDGLLAAILADAQQRPAVVRALAGVAVDSGMGQAHTKVALTALDGLDADTTSAVDQAASKLGSPAPWRALQYPAVLPGQMPGLDALEDPTVDQADVVLRPSTSVFQTSTGLARLLGGLAMVGVAGVVGARLRRWRPLAGMSVAVGLLALTDGAAAMLGAPTGASSLPLFSFIAQSEVVARDLPGAADQVWLGGGSMRLTVVHKVPQAGIMRVAVLGASTVHGSHYVADDAFVAQLDRSLPGVEVHNLGIGGATSAGVASAGRAALDLGADLLVIAYGHNEAAQFTRLALYNHTSPAWLSARLWLSQSPLYTALARRLRSQASTAPPADLYRSAPPTREEVRQLIDLAVLHFQHQVGGLIAEAQARGAAVVLVIPPTNLRFAHLQPFTTPGPGDAADLDRLRAEAEAAARRGDGALAGQLLQEAVDRSASPRELVTPIRDEIIRLGGIYGVPVVDAQAWFSAFAPDGLSPRGLFWDDVHPSRAGHARMAEVLLPVLEQELDR